MSKVRVPVIGTVGKSVQIDTDLGARVAALEAALAALRLATGEGELKHKELQGLQAGDDHPQYTMWNQNENIRGQWQFEKSIWGPQGSAAAPTYTRTGFTDDGLYFPGNDNVGIATAGVARWDVNTARVQQSLPLIVNVRAAAQDLVGLQVNQTGAAAGANGGFEVVILNTSTPDDDTGVQMGMWEAGDGVFPPVDAAGGYRWRMAGDLASGADLIFYSHQNSASGTEIYRHHRDAAQMIFIKGTAGAPPIAFGNGDEDTGIFSAAINGVNITTAGISRFGIDSSAIRSTLPFRADSGTAGSPAYSFNTSPTLGWYLIAANRLGGSVSGTQRFELNASELITTVPIRGPAGSNTAPTHSYDADDNTGHYNVGADVLGTTVGGTLRQDWTTTAMRLVTDNYALQIGASQDLTLTHDGTDSILDNNTGLMRFVGGSTLAASYDTSGIWSFPTAATVSGAWKFTVGIELEGNAGTSRFVFDQLDAGTDERIWRIFPSSGDLFFGAANTALTNETYALVLRRAAEIVTSVDLLLDNLELRIGAGNDLRLYHDGTNSIIENDTGLLRILGATSGEIVVNTTGALYGTALHNNSGAVTGTTNQYVVSGTYTPTLTNVANLDSSTAAECQWMRVGNVVTVSGRVIVDPTTAGVQTNLGISLPIASTTSSTSDVGGSASSTTTASQCGGILADTTNNRAELAFVPTVNTGEAMYFVFMYEVK